MILELPFSSDPAQRFVTQLGDRKFVFEAKYNDRSGVWTFDLWDDATQEVMLQSVPLLLGQNLLEPYNFGIGHMLCYDTTNQGLEVGPYDLGDRVKVYWLSPGEFV